MSKPTIIIIAIAVVCAAGGFVGGMQYQQSKGSTVGPGGAGFGNFQNLTQEQRDQMRQQFAGGNGVLFTGGGRNGRSSGGGFVSGEVLSKDENGITLKTQDGGSRIVFLSSSTEVSKFDKGSSADVIVGEKVVVSGIANSDGTLTAQSIQIRPSLLVGNPQ